MRKISASLLTLVFLLTASPLWAADQATPQEVYEMVTKAANLLKELGPEGLPAFNDPKGEFVWKDSYVFVMDCGKGTIAAHPNPKLIGLPGDKIRCLKTGRPILLEACQGMSAQGQWNEYWWNKPGQDGIFRKISFAINVPGQPYQVGAGIYNDTVSLDELQKTLK
ncbi:MAG: cache domain-containing protein [Deltaproteobacteria bacterium]|nr:cache domain-containing protein [Deltaproteobacteria bacterium]